MLEVEGSDADAWGLETWRWMSEARGLDGVSHTHNANTCHHTQAHTCPHTYRMHMHTNTCTTYEGPLGIRVSTHTFWGPRNGECSSGGGVSAPCPLQPQSTT